EHVLEVLSATRLVAARAVALLDEAARERAADLRHLPVGIGDPQIDVGRRRVPRDHELHRARRDPAALVDDAVAVVVARVQAPLGPARDAGPRDVEHDASVSLPLTARRSGGRCRGARAREGGEPEARRDHADSAPHLESSGMFTPTTIFGCMSSKYASRASSPVFPGSLRSASSTPCSFMNLSVRIAPARFASSEPRAIS